MKWKNIMILDKIALRPLKICAFLFFGLFSNALPAFFVLFVAGFFNGFSRNFYYIFEKMTWFINFKGILAKSHRYKSIALETSVNYYFKTCPCYIGINFYCTTVMTSTKVKRKSSRFLSGHFSKNEKKTTFTNSVKKINVKVFPFKSILGLSSPSNWSNFLSLLDLFILINGLFLAHKNIFVRGVKFRQNRKVAAPRNYLLLVHQNKRTSDSFCIMKWQYFSSDRRNQI